MRTNAIILDQPLSQIAVCLIDVVKPYGREIEPFPLDRMVELFQRWVVLWRVRPREDLLNSQCCAGCSKVLGKLCTVV